MVPNCVWKLSCASGNVFLGKSETFITEACEYTNSFLNFFPKIGIILNIEADHLDFFKDLEDIRHSFHQFAALLPDDGTLVINGEIDNYPEIYDELSCRIITYGFSKDFDYSAENIAFDEKGCASFDLLDVYKRQEIERNPRGALGECTLHTSTILSPVPPLTLAT